MGRPSVRRAALAAAILAAALGVAGATRFLEEALEPVNLCCDPGSDSGSEQPRVANSNLGGLGPDKYRAPINIMNPEAAPENLRFRGILVGSGNDAPRKLDLVVTAASAYSSNSPYRNGMHGSLFQVNVAAGTTVALDLTFRDAETDERVTVRELGLVVLDLDEDPGRTSQTGVSATGYKHVVTHLQTELRTVQSTGGTTWFLSQEVGTKPDSPSTLELLTHAQERKAVAFQFEDVDQVRLHYHVTVGQRDHDLLFGLRLCRSCGGGLPPPTPPPTTTPFAATRAPAATAPSPLMTPPPSVQQRTSASTGWGGFLWSLLTPHHGEQAQYKLVPAQSPPAAAPAAPFPEAPPAGDRHVSFAAAPEITRSLGQGKGAQVDSGAFGNGGFGGPKSVNLQGRAWPVSVHSSCNGTEVEWAACWGPCHHICGACCDGNCAVNPATEQNSTDCALGEWEPWTVCSVTCGSGWQSHMRNVDTPASGGGLLCEGSLWEIRECQGPPCPGDGTFSLGHWSEWLGCNPQNPTERFRSRELEPSGPRAGLSHGGTQEMELCPSAMPEDCKFSAWDAWSACDKECGGGQTARTRRIAVMPHGGGACPRKDLRETQPCNTQPCGALGRIAGSPDCIMGPWESWTDCNEMCRGTHERKRSIEQEPKPGGKGCTTKMAEVQPCSNSMCVVTDCRWADWELWSACTCTCGGGSHRRSRQVAVSPQNGGKLCDPVNKSQVGPCNTQPCDICIDGKWDAWSHWTECSTTCGNGFQWRDRNIGQQASTCGIPAAGQTAESRLCKNEPSEVCGDKDCKMGDWADWSACSCTCFGVRERSRIIVEFHSGLGRPCVDESLKELEPCSPGPIDPIPVACEAATMDCELSEWTHWDLCPVTCGGGNRERKRVIIRQASNNGRPCEAPLVETMPCGTQPCSVSQCIDCLWSQWSDWGECAKCGDQRYRHRGIERLPNHCGRRCAAQDAKEVSNCTSHCEKARYCGWKDWSDWSGCNAECGTSSRMRERYLTITAQRPMHPLFLLPEGATEGLTTCAGTQVDMEECPGPVKPCEHDAACTVEEREEGGCLFGAWTEWLNPCSNNECNGLCERSRVIKRMNTQCGAPCNGPLEETKACHHHVDQSCEFTAWSTWTCAGPDTCLQKRRVREVSRQATGNQPECRGDLEETKPCLEDPGALRQDCLMDVWSEWTQCSTTCGGGWHVRIRSVRSPARNGGTPCSAGLEQGESCGHVPCEGERCTVSDWGEWHGCMSFGQQYRRRRLTMDGSGHDCGEMGSNVVLSETKPCDLEHQIVDCMLSQWSRWYGCDKTCGGGQQTRDRQVELYPKNGGRECPSSLREVRGCNTQACASTGGCTDGLWAEWETWSFCSVTCGGGLRSRSRLRKRMANECGKPPSGLSHETENCHSESCGPDIDCLFETWSEWTICSKTCNGVKRRSRDISVYGRGKGKSCQGDIQQTFACNPAAGEPLPDACEKPDPVDAILSDWGQWSGCPVTCGGGQQRRVRNITQPAEYGGVGVMGSLLQTAECAPGVCPTPHPVDCIWSQWTDWGECDKCDGQRNRMRHVLKPALYGGSCDSKSAEETGECHRSCHEKAFCVWEDWEPWSDCALSPCRTSGRRNRVRRLAQKSAVELGMLEAGPAQELYEDRGREAGLPWPLAGGLRPEVLVAFVCGYFGRVSVLAAAGAWSRRTARAERYRGDGEAASLAMAWLGGGGGLTAALRGGYRPVATEAEGEA